MLVFHRPLLVEVKPEFTQDALATYEAKIDASGWEDEALIVEATPLLVSTEEGHSLGRLRDTWWELGDHYSPTWCWDEAAWMNCPHCHRPSLRHAIQSYECRVCGHNSGGGVGAPSSIETLWNEAGSTVRWRAPSPTAGERHPRPQQLGA